MAGKLPQGFAMQCPKCSSSSRRDGRVRGKQRYECGNPQCGYHFVAAPLPVGAPMRMDTPSCPSCYGKLHKRFKRNGWQYFQCVDCKKYSRV